jgi:GNAT superfamily N-acetyltransferase
VAPIAELSIAEVQRVVDIHSCESKNVDKIVVESRVADAGDQMTKPTHQIALETEPKGDDMNVIVKGLLDFNRLRTGGETPEYLLVTVRNEEGAVIGGLLGATYLGWILIHSVWLPEELRGLNYGTELMSIAEAEGLRRGCKRSFLETYSFQALVFYEKLGYTIHSQLAGFPVGGARYALTKDLPDSK